MNWLQWVVFGVFSYGAIVAAGSWLVSTRRINPFGKPARALKSMSEPALNPIENWLLKRGGNPQSAPQWLLGLTVVGGIVAISIVDWLAGQIALFGAVGQTGTRGVVRLVVFYAGQAVTMSIFVRVIGSWFGAGRFNPLMKPFFFLTDWIVEPIRRRVPPMGMIDISPFIAYFLLQFLIIPMILRFI